MRLFVTADNHFYHKSAIKYNNRPFKTVGEMNTSMIQSWNNTVNEDDTVIVLGDFCFGGITKWKEILDRINGEIFFVSGNHDNYKVVKVLEKKGYFKELHTLGFTKQHGKDTLYFSHFPIMLGSLPNYFSICGHFHGKETGQKHCIDVGVDASLSKSTTTLFGAPINMAKVYNRIEELNNEVTMTVTNNKTNYNKSSKK